MTIPTPIAYWKFDEGAGATAAITTGDAGDALSLQGNAAWETGVGGQALSLPAAAGDFAQNLSPSFSEIKTISFWFNPDAVINAATAAGTFLTLRGVSNLDWYCIGFGAWSGAIANEIVFLIEDDGPTAIRAWADGAAEIAAGSWHHLLISNTTASSWTIWVDGDKKTPTDDGIPGNLSSIERVVVGSRVRTGQANDAPYAGGMDEMAFFNEEFSDAQVAEIYNGGTPADLASGETLTSRNNVWNTVSATPDGLGHATGFINFGPNEA